MGTYITFPDLLIWIPLLAGLLCFITPDKQARRTAGLFSLVVLAVSVTTLFFSDAARYLNWNNVNYIWLKHIGANYYIGLDGMGRLMTLLTALSFPLIILSSSKGGYRNPSSFYGLLMLTQAGLMGVFLALDALTFYFFWELALIPVYFLSSQWGGERRIAATFKFFIYTFLGSLLMLAGIIYVYLHTGARTFEDGTFSAHSFSFSSFYGAELSPTEQGWLFVLFMAAFAIKMPIFPFHTWQPEAYDQAPYPVTMVLSAVMVKMGLFGVYRWLLPLFPDAPLLCRNVVIGLSVAGIVYASALALVQDNIRKLVAYSSIAHIGLMSAALFTLNTSGVQGVLLQMFNHGINILGMWMVVEIIERKTGVKKISELSGLAAPAPLLTIFFVVIALANIALPLTNAFTGEFLMFSGLFRYNVWVMSVAGLGVILSAVYTLNLIQKVFLGSVNQFTRDVTDIGWSERLSLGVLVVLIFLIGIYPQPLINLTRESVHLLLQTVTRGA